MTYAHFYIDSFVGACYSDNDTMSFILMGGLHMPKVTDEYLTDKRNYILECTGEILNEKPLYLITMRDIIKKAGLSQGAIYRYYANLEEIHVDYVNKNTTYNQLERDIDTLLSSEQTETAILSECILAIGGYIEALLKSVGGKTCFELTVLYAYDFEKRATVFPRLKFKQSLEYAQNRILEYSLGKVEEGIFNPQISIRSIIMFVSGFIDGIAQSVATGAAAGHDNPADISVMFQTLAKAVTGFMGGF
jgi:AcrR family transcriptional regulator